jgi:prepilin-type N-terminal cleavage/methylation domain-containing protein
VVSAVPCRAVASCVGWSAALRRIHEQKETKKTKIVGLVELPPIHDSRLRLGRAYGSERFTIHQRARNAFTLIELLVVVIMIAILAGLLFPAFIGVQNQAKKVQAKNDLTQIVTAVNAFYAEYGKYPLVTADTTITGTTTPSNADLFYSLRAVALGANAPVNGVPAINPRAIVFISPPDAKNQSQPKSGIATGPPVTVNGILIPTGSFVDPWGTPYNVKIDGSYDNQLSNPYPDTDGSAGASTLQIGVISWSYGGDQAQGTKGTSTNYKNSDDVISWQ